MRWDINFKGSDSSDPSVYFLFCAHSGPTSEGTNTQLMTSRLTRIFRQVVRSYKIPNLFYSQMTGPVEEAITNKLKAELNPSFLNVINESNMHNVPKDSETHFKVVVVSDKFEKLSLIQRHRLVNQILHSEMATSIHALSIQAKTPEQWEKSEGKVSKSPPCLGGSGS